MNYLINEVLPVQIKKKNLQILINLIMYLYKD